jgi:type IV pilus assembly protein PilF
MQNFGWYLCQQSRYAEADSMFTQALGVPLYRDSPRTLLTHIAAGRITPAPTQSGRAWIIPLNYRYQPPPTANSRY